MDKTSSSEKPIDLERLTREMDRLRQASISKRTAKSYACDWRCFTRWCDHVGRISIPASTDTLALYVTYVLDTGRRISTASRHVSAIIHHHRDCKAAWPDPKPVAKLLAGARRLTRETPKQVAALATRDLRAISRSARDSDPLSVRDRAILLFGFASALRRSNIARLRLEDVTFTSKGVRIIVRNEKQNQSGQDREIALGRSRSTATCPVRALERWLKLRGDMPGYVFNAIIGARPIMTMRISDRRVGQVVRAAVSTIGLDPARFNGHSLRAGFITEALERGVGEVRVAAHSGHKSLQTLKRYYRPRDPFRINACAMVGL